MMNHFIMETNSLYEFFIVYLFLITKQTYNILQGYASISYIYPCGVDIKQEIFQPCAIRSIGIFTALLKCIHNCILNCLQT